MPRTPRLDYPGATHHTFNRGANKAPVFRDRADYEAFLCLLAAVPERFGVRVLAYALMTNHFHLVLVVLNGNLSEVMQYLLGGFAKRLNGRHGLDGSPFRGRFSNRLVETEDYLQTVLAYVHANPVAAGMVTQAVEAEWTSHRAAMGLIERPRWLDLGWVDDVFGGRGRLAEAVDGWQGEEEPCPPPSTAALETPDASLVRATSVAEALAVAARVSGAPRPSIRRVRGRKGQFVAWALAALAGLSHHEIASILGVSRMAVTHRIRRFEQWCTQDPLGMAWRGAAVQR